MQRSVPESRKDIFNRQRRRARDARVIRSKGVELMSVRGRDQRFLETRRDLRRAAIWIEKAGPKMTELDRVETIDSSHQLFAQGTAEDVKRMRRDRKKRLAPSGAQGLEIVQGPERFDFARCDVEQNDVCPLQSNLGGRDDQHSHAGGIRENFRAIENGVVQRNREHTKPERPGPLEELVRRVIERVLRIVERMEVEIDLDPLGIRHCSADYADFGPPLLAFLRS